MILMPTMMLYEGGPRHRELFAVEDDVLIDTFALPLSQCNGSQEWAAYYRSGDKMVFGGRAYTFEHARELAREVMENPPRKKARRLFRGGL